MSSEAFDLANLARWVLTRRRELDLSHEDVADRGGPSTTKMSQIENPDRHPNPPRRDVLKKLDRALDWREGSARAALLGGKPLPRPQGQAADDGREDLRRRILEAPYLSADEKAEILAALERRQPPPSDHQGEVRGA